MKNNLCTLAEEELQGLVQDKRARSQPMTMDCEGLGVEGGRPVRGEGFDGCDCSRASGDAWEGWILQMMVAWAQLKRSTRPSWDHELMAQKPEFRGDELAFWKT